MHYRIDANGKVLGRLASEIAVLLRGKNKPDFIPNAACVHKVAVINADKIIVTGNKGETKFYWHYTRYPGGIKKASLKELRQKDPGRVLRKAVYGMLPKNRQRAIMMKNLAIK